MELEVAATITSMMLLEGNWRNQNSYLTEYIIATEYQIDIMHRGLELEQNYYNGERVNSNLLGSTRLDVYDTTSGQVYDYKFVVNPGKGVPQAQKNKIMAQGPGEIKDSDIHEVNPQN